MSGEYSDHLDFYTRGPYAPFVTEVRSAGRTPIRLIHTSQPAGDFSDPAQPDFVLMQVIRPPTSATEDLGAGRYTGKYRRGDFSLMPQDTTSIVLADSEHEVRDLVLPGGPLLGLVGGLAPDFSGDFGRLHARPFRDFFLEQLCGQLWRESEAGNPHGNLFADGALISIAATLLRLRDRAASDVASCSINPLGEGLRSRIDDYINAHLDQNLTIRTLADLTNQPEAAFVPAFKAAFGQTPHQYVLSRRIARARELLAASSMPLAEVAAVCGYASQSHMTDVFRQKLGVTPGRYRKEVRE